MGFTPHNAERAAKLSWVLALAILAYSVISNQAIKQFDDSRVIAIANGLVVLTLVLSGITCAIYAMCGIPKWGRRGILAPALTGLILNGLFLGLFVLGFMIAFAARPQPRIEPWQTVISANATYQVEVMGTIEKKENTTGAGENLLVIHTIKAKSYNARALMTAEQITFTSAFWIVPTEGLINPLIEGTLAQHHAQETSRETHEGVDPRTVVYGRLTDVPGELTLVVRRDSNVVYFLSYIANAHVADQAEADRFFNSFRRLEDAEED